tara:strand:+ start:3536 stop:3637 length:102 start_codon:yes stop_codon:yes gene_type:complete
MDNYKKAIYISMSFTIGILVANYIQTKIIDKKK